MATKSLFKLRGPDETVRFNLQDVDGEPVLIGQKIVANGYMADVSTAGQIYIVLPVACTVVGVYTALNGAITGADAVLTAKNAAGTSMGTITIANAGSAAGDVDSLAPTSNNTFAAGTAIEIETNGGSTGTVPVFVTVVAKVTGG